MANPHHTRTICHPLSHVAMSRSGPRARPVATTGHVLSDTPWAIPHETGFEKTAYLRRSVPRCKEPAHLKTGTPALEEERHEILDIPLCHQPRASSWPRTMFHTASGTVPLCLSRPTCVTDGSSGSSHAKDFTIWHSSSVLRGV